MKNKLNKKVVNRKLILISIELVMLLGFVVLASSLGDKDALQSELNNLTLQLNSQGYGWFVNYSVDYNNINDTSKVNVYEKDSDNLIATFYNITSLKEHKIYLTNLPDNYSQSVFDLRSSGDVEYDYVRNVYLIRIPEHPENPEQTQGFLDVVDSTVYGIPKGVNLLNNSYGTFAGISARGADGTYGVLIPHDVYLMKMRIDSIREELNKNGGFINM